jgi:hypothetical protein
MIEAKIWLGHANAPIGAGGLVEDPAAGTFRRAAARRER